MSESVPGVLLLADTRPERWLCWKEWRLIDGEKTPRLLTPRAEHLDGVDQLDGIFDTPGEAYQYLDDYLVSDREQLVLCEVVLTPVRVVTTHRVEDDTFLVSDNATGDLVHETEAYLTP